ncbi:DUF4097 and DUF4098 domain-containing protein YvlB [Lactobacillus colini]|uniref:DUF4097 and DUF4098 domain-containing protein YvlB n=1 Tax=Lactobacillus colini TaxID=1819254 RepID=A0ABS4MD14_9LACO|nr:DUF4097 family beta strand repeat-containing protein [Lactobacillus colini]MBP2057582.1 DUF4097 and DUF4098 domain-containing protein YvlB [Lactobacillus colini]
MKKFIPRILTFLGMLVVLVLIGGCSKSTSSKPTKEVTKTLTSKVFTDLKIISQNADIIIQPGKNYKITYYGKNTTMPLIKQKKDQVTVNQVKAQHALGLMRLPKITITIPKKSKLIKLRVKTSDADVRINNLNLKRGIISSDDGDIIISDSKLTDGMNLRSTTGNIKVKGTKFTGYKLTTSDGQIQVKDHATSSSYLKNAKSKNVLVAKSGSKEIWIK